VEGVRLAELIAGMSMVADIGMGLEPGEASRAALVALELADASGANAHDAYYTTLLQHIGCTGYAYEAAQQLGGDDIAVKRAAMRTNFAKPREIFGEYLPNLAPTAGLLTRARVAGYAATHARGIVAGYSRSNCEVAHRVAQRVGMRDSVADALLNVYEQWDGKGGPRGIAGEDIPIAARIAQAGVIVSLFHSLGGPDAAIAAVAARAGRSLDPGLADLIGREPARYLGALAVDDALTTVIDQEPGMPAQVLPMSLEEACRAFGESVDLKSPYLHGHAAGVARLAGSAAASAGLSKDEARSLVLAGHLHDLGRAAVATGIWDRPGPLSWAEQEQVRLHAHYSERMLTRCGSLAVLAPIVGAHHERLDGSGYHRQLGAAGIEMSGRILAAADAYQAMTQERPYRSARSDDEAAAVLTDEARAGRLDADAVAAVLNAAGHAPAVVKRENPAGLTDRQVEVLRLVASGLSNAQIAERLVISRRTAEHHVQDMYGRIGISSRAAAALFAMEHDLL
jgi:HD-GYP domain-containing protein (c-di-GMP phosphodiesterase class II)